MGKLNKRNHAEDKENTGHQDDGQVAAETRRILQIADAFGPDIVVRIEAVDLAGVLTAIENE